MIDTEMNRRDHVGRNTQKIDGFVLGVSAVRNDSGRTPDVLKKVPRKVMDSVFGMRFRKELKGKVMNRRNNCLRLNFQRDKVRLKIKVEFSRMILGYSASKPPQTGPNERHF